jgi:hypothetical protein
MVPSIFFFGFTILLRTMLREIFGSRDLLG